ncbi:MAG: outer membrane beta-barrel protein [Opitutaceae bacterium]|nr:outer membrane beta-barrel protein [Opitutaceae bacterium]
MTNKLRSGLVFLAMAGAAVAALAQGGDLIGTRYAAVDLEYLTWDDGGHMTGGNVALNVPSTMKGIDLGIELGYADGGFDGINTDRLDGAAFGVFHSKQQGFTPYLRAAAGYARYKASYMGYSASDSSFVYSVGAGVEVLMNEKASIDLRVSYEDATDFEDDDFIEARVGLNYAISDKIALRVAYARDFDSDGNTITGGMVFRY